MRKKRTAGRPRFEPGRAKAERVTLRFSKAEAAELHRQAKAAGKGISEFLQDRLRNQLLSDKS
jgi:hypothetical protein